jgi:signal transduction histidine kinase
MNGREDEVRAGAGGAMALRSTAAAIALASLGAALLALAIGWQANRMLAARTLVDLDAVIAALVRDRTTAAALLADVAERSTQAGPWSFGLLDAELRRLTGDAPADVAAPLLGGETVVRLVDATGRETLAAGRARRLADGATLVVLRTIEDERRLARQIQVIVGVGTILLSLAAFAVGHMAQRRQQARIAGITAAADAIMAGRLTARVPLDGSDDDIDHLAAHLNAMLARIEALMQAMRDLSDNVAHDLKTPLSRLRMTAESALGADPSGAREGLTRVIEEADGLIAVFNAMLLVARLERDTVEQQMDLVDASAVVADAAELYGPTAEDQGFAMTTSVTPGAWVRANRQLLAQAVANLLDNAIKYGRPDAPGVDAAVSLGVTVRDGAVEIAVSDRGIGIAKADRARVLERFVRLEKSRSAPGTGLGLSLVAAIVRLHRGTLRLEDAAPGLRVVIRLDAAPASARASVTQTAALPS